MRVLDGDQFLVRVFLGESPVEASARTRFSEEIVASGEFGQAPIRGTTLAHRGHSGRCPMSPRPAPPRSTYP